MNIYYVDAVVDLRSFSNPIKNFITNIYKGYDTNVYKYCEYSLVYNTINTDANFLLKSYDLSETFTTLKSLSCDTIEYNNDTKDILSLYIYSSNLSYEYNRKYIKVPDIIASVGGLMQVFYLCFNIFSKQFANIYKYEKIIAKVFYSEDDLKSLHRKIDNFNSSFSNKKLNIYTSNKIVDMNELRIRITTINTKLRLNLSLFDRLKIMSSRVCNHKEMGKIRLYDIGKNIIKKYFDFVYIIRRFEELEKLKYMLLSENQINILKVINKTRISTLVEGRVLDSSLGEMWKYADDFMKGIKTTKTANDEKLLDLLLG
jgi:hypothetical protein